MHPEFQGFDGLLEEMGQKFAAFAEYAAQDFRNGEDIHAVRNIEGDVPGDPIGGFESSSLMARRTESTSFAGECEEFFVSTIRAVQTGKALSEIAATVVFFDNLNGVSAERAVGFPVVGLVLGLELVPTLVDDLPKR